MLAPAFGADSSWRAPGSNVEPEASGKLERMLQRVAQKLDVIAGEQSRMSDRLAKLELSAETYRSNTAGMGGLSPIPESFKKMSIAAGDSSNPRLSMRGPSANDAELKKIAKLQGEEVYGTETHASTSHFSREETTPNRRAMAKRFLIPPHSKFRLWWDGTACVLIFFIALVLPYRTAFVETWSLGWTINDFLVDCFFLIDIAINFRTMYYDQTTGELVTSPTKIAINYARTWLAIDLIASLPIDWFSSGVSFTKPKEEEGKSSAAQFTLLLRIFKLVKLLRLLRLARLFRYLGKWEENIQFLSSNILRLLKLLVFLIIFSHWNGCVQYFIANFDLEQNPETDEVEIHPDTWVQRAGLVEKSEGMKWSWAFYHAMTQLLAISVGVVPPMRPAELWGYLISILLGAALYAVFVASLTAVFTELGASGREYRSKIDMLHQYMRNLRMPPDLCLKLQSYFELCFPDRQMFNERDIIDQLSHPLQSEIALLKCKMVITSLRIGTSEHLGRSLALVLERVVFVDKDYIIRTGDFGRGMYFISSGTVAVYMPGKSDPVTTLGRNAFFGEMALLDPTGRARGDVVVKGFCEGYHLSRENFHRLQGQYPDFRQFIENVAKLRQQRNDVKGVGGAPLPSDLPPIDAAECHPTKRRLKRQATQGDVLKEKSHLKRQATKGVTDFAAALAITRQKITAGLTGGSSSDSTLDQSAGSAGSRKLSIGPSALGKGVRRLSNMRKPGGVSGLNFATQLSSSSPSATKLAGGSSSEKLQTASV